MREAAAMSGSRSRTHGNVERADERKSDLSQTDMDRCRREVVESDVFEGEVRWIGLGCLSRRWRTRGRTMMSVALVRIRNRFVDRSRCFV